MSMLWQGGEDISFLNGSPNPASVVTSGGFRSGWARCALAPQPWSVGTTPCKGNRFGGGAITSGWASWLANVPGQNTFQGTQPPSLGGFGVFSGAGQIFLGSAANTELGLQKAALYKYDGTTFTQLATESAASLSLASLQRFDLQLINFGSSGTLNLYLNKVLIISFTGDLTLSGVTGFDCFVIGPWASLMVYGQCFSEVMVASDDTRTRLGLATLAPAGQGTTNAWTNDAYGNIDGVSYSDANPTYDNNNGDDQQYALNSLPSGTWNPDTVTIAARAAVGSGSSVAHLELGYNVAGTVGFGSGATKAPGGSYATWEQLDLQNPVTVAAWTQAQINALQLDMRALT